MLAKWIIIHRSKLKFQGQVLGSQPFLQIGQQKRGTTRSVVLEIGLEKWCVIAVWDEVYLVLWVNCLSALNFLVFDSMAASASKVARMISRAIFMGHAVRRWEGRRAPGWPEQKFSNVAWRPPRGWRAGSTANLSCWLYYISKIILFYTRTNTPYTQLSVRKVGPCCLGSNWKLGESCNNKYWDAEPK